MRVWDVHPGYLSNRSLLGQHAEIHAVFSIISKCKSGYSAHPETLRWKDNLAGLATNHDLTVKEMVLRRFKHASPICASEISDGNKTYVDAPVRQFEILSEKYRQKAQNGRIPLPKNNTQFWGHHKYSVMARGYQYYKNAQVIIKNTPDHPIQEQNEFVFIILALLEKDPAQGAIRNVIDHLWGYFKKDATTAEKQYLIALAQQGQKQQVAFLFNLAEKYNKTYLLESTVFADL